MNDELEFGTAVDPVGAEALPATPLLHIAEDDGYRHGAEGYYWRALCGARCRHMADWPGVRPSCVVCVDLDRGRPTRRPRE